MTKKVVQVHPEGHESAGQPTGLILFTFDDGTTEAFDASKVSGNIAARLALHGASQKIGDSYAGAKDDPSPIEYAKAAVRETIAQLYAGDWRATVAAGPRTPDLAVALSRLSGESIEASVEFVGTLDDDQKKVWRAKPAVKATLAAIAAEKAAAKAVKLAEAAKDAGPLSLS